MSKDISIVVLSHNRKECLAKNIQSLCKSAKGNFRIKIIIVDNNSTDGSKNILERLENEYQNVEIVFNKKNLGVAQGRNKGYKKCTGEYIVSLDDDTIISLEQIFELLESFENYPKAGILAPKIQHYKTGDYQFYHGEKPMEVANFHGSCRAYRRNVFEEVGYLDEECTFGGEEIDYSIRCRNSGFGTIYIPGVTARHNNYTRKGDIGKERRRLRVYNFIRLQYKHFRMPMSFLYSFRILVSHFYSGLREYGWLFALGLILPAIKGVKQGKTNQKLVSEEVHRFYKDKTLEPDFGNKPIYYKLLKKLSISYETQ